MTTPAYGIDGTKRVIKSGYPNAGFVLSAEIGCGVLILCFQQSAQELRTPGFGIELGNTGVEALVFCASLPRYMREQGREQLDTVRSPCPRPQTAELARGQGLKPSGIVRPRLRSFPHFHEFRQCKPRVLDSTEQAGRRAFGHQDQIILPAQKLGQIREVARQLRLMLARRELPPVSDERFSEWIKHEDVRRPPLGF